MNVVDKTKSVEVQLAVVRRLMQQKNCRDANNAMRSVYNANVSNPVVRNECGELAVEMCEILASQSFLKAGGVIARDLPDSVRGDQRRGLAAAQRGGQATVFHKLFLFSLHTLNTCSPDAVKKAAKGLCKHMLVMPGLPSVVCRIRGFLPFEVVQQMPGVLKTAEDIRYVSQSPEGFRLMQLLLIQDTDRPRCMYLEQLQRMILATFSIRQLFRIAVSLHAGDDNDTVQKSMSLAEFWMSLRPQGSPKGWAHVDRSKSSWFRRYKIWQHYIAVDRAILRYCFKLCKGPLGQMNGDVIGEVEGYLYGVHSWPTFFFRDTYSRTKKMMQ